MQKKKIGKFPDCTAKHGTMHGRELFDGFRFFLKKASGFDTRPGKTKKEGR